MVAREHDVPPDEVEKSLTRPLESALITVLGVERLRARTIRGAVELSLQFAPGTDMWRALQLTESRVAEARASLPAGTEVVVERLTTTSFPVVTFNLTGPIDPRRLRELGELVLRPALSRIRGVGRIEVLGGDVREVEVVLDPERTAALHLRPTDVVERLRASTVLRGGRPARGVARAGHGHGLGRAALARRHRAHPDRDRRRRQPGAAVGDRARLRGRGGPPAARERARAARRCC